MARQYEIEPTDVASSGYLGPQACAECHRERVSEFMLTSHFRACRIPEPGAMPNGFQPGHGRFVSQHSRLEFEMTQLEGDFFQTAILSTPNGQHQTISRIDLAYGFPPTDEVYFTWRDDRLYELPVAWLHPHQEWGISPIDPHGAGGSDFSRPLSVRCLECHNTWFEHVPGTLNQYKRDNIVLGVTCERCHGPGRDHVTYHRAHPDDKTSQAIVHPGHLSRTLLMDICAQCHSNAIKHRGPAFSYRPGQPLEASYKTVSSRNPEDDHVANQTKYLQQSKCFQHSETMTCITCHDPHKSPDHSPNHENSSTRSCLTCHSATDCGDHDRLPGEVRDKCIACHMPARNKIQVYFDTAHDNYVAPVKAYEHHIGIYPVARQEVLLAWRRTQSDDESRRLVQEITEELVKHWVEEGDKLRRDYRHLAAIDAYRKGLELKPDPEIKLKLQQTVSDHVAMDEKWFAASRQIAEQKFSDAAVALEQILLLKPDLAKVHGKLGTVYATLGRRDQAILHLQAVAKFDPDDPYGEGMLGWMAYLEGRYQAAIDHYRNADEIEPYKAKIHFQWGIAAARMEAWEQAAEHFRLALTIDPNHADACDNLSHVLSNLGRQDDAVQFAIRATRITSGKHPGMLLHLAELYAESQRFQDARTTASDALIAGQNSHSQLIPIIQKRLTEYRQLEQKQK